ncbi:MAG: SMC family ATPase [Thermoplasmata archaeon]|nr:SMC family ATPase [Thermoplasmata archaeon]
MQLRSVKVRNIRSYREGAVEFPAGRTLLVGDVGSGKTSLLQAVEMALFGFAEVSPEHLVRHQEREAEVTLRLEGDGHHYEFRRSFRRRRVRGRESFDTEESSFAVDGHRIRYSATELRQRAIELLGFPDNPSPKAHSDVWRWAVYIPQERMREVLLQRPDERLETVRKALGIENYRTAAENAGELSSDLVRIAERADAQAEGLRHWEAERDGALQTAEEQGRVRRELEPRADAARKELAESEATIREAEARAARASSDAARERQLSAELELRRRELEGARTTASRARERAGELLAHAEQLEAQLAAARPDTSRGQAVRERLATLERDLAALDQAARDLSAAQASRDSTARSREEATRRLARGESDHDELSQELERLLREPPVEEPAAPAGPNREELSRLEEATRVELAAAEAASANLEFSRKELAELIKLGECPRCHQRVDPSQFGSHAAEARAAAQAARRHADTLDEDRKRLVEARHLSDLFERTRERWLQLERRRADLRETLHRTEGQLKDARISIGSLDRELEGYRQRVAELLPLEDQRKALLANRTEAMGELERLEQRGTELGRLEEGARGERAQSSQFLAEASRSEQHGTDLTVRIETLEAELLPLRASPSASANLERTLDEGRRRRVRSQEILEDLLQQTAAARQREEGSRQRAQEAEERLGERRSLVDRASHDRALASWIRTEFRSGLLELERRRLSRAHAEFNRLLARYFSRLIDDPSLLARCDASFAPEVEIEGEPTPAEALSGGERTALALAFRLAMGAVVRNSGRLRLDTLILDEPTDGFSPEQVLRLGELLESVEIPQVILVSHERQLAAAADHVVNVTKQDGASRLESDGSPTRPPEPVPTAEPATSSPRKRRRRLPRLAASETPAPATAAAPPP